MQAKSDRSEDESGQPRRMRDEVDQKSNACSMFLRCMPCGAMLQNRGACSGTRRSKSRADDDEFSHRRAAVLM